jgi:DNA-binding response OmpR family regulator
MGRERILIVEDDKKLARALETELKRAYSTCVVRVGRDALVRAENEAFDLILLDLNLPDMDGIEVAKQLEGNDAAILMLTARGDLRSRVAGLYAGASDYLSKPFDMQELLARVYAQLRRRTRPEEFNVGALTLSTKLRSCTVDGKPIKLSAQEILLLTLLITNQGRVYSKSTIEERLHRDEPPNSNTVEALISKLRSKLASAGVHDIIQTIRGLGYVIREHKA